MESKRILIFPCGTEIGLEIHNALKYFKYFDLYGASSEEDHGRMIYKNYIGNVPYVDDENFITYLNKIIDENKIDFIFPAHDSVVLQLAKDSKNIHCEIITSDFYTCDVCRSKSKTYELFPEISPKVYKISDEHLNYPLFLKPDVGQGSQGTVKVNNNEELKFHINENSKLLILEYLPGKEYTIDCFTNESGELLFSGVRERIRTRNGISVRSKTNIDIDDKIVEMANIINTKLNLRGMWFFQVKLDSDNKYKLLEIAPRIAGTMCLYRNDGVNFPLLSVYDRIGYDVDIINNKLEIEVDRALINRFLIKYNYDTVFIDFDDTIIIKNKVNKYIMMFLYQCVNENKKIILLTKHIEDIYKTLNENKICVELFDKIIHISKSEQKISFIKDYKNSIFIDDSFNERKLVHNEYKIPCFDLDMIESLIDWKY